MLTDPDEALYALAYRLGWPPQWILDIPDEHRATWTAYTEGRCRGETVAAQRRSRQ
ncbi:MAG: hypothetical protein OXG44_10725 [Gammaproteobacteria bacterium]|nr:hypothetical protein [Gammaproteobacteria bacterium]